MKLEENERLSFLAARMASEADAAELAGASSICIRISEARYLAADVIALQAEVEALSHEAQREAAHAMELEGALCEIATHQRAISGGLADYSVVLRIADSALAHKEQR